MKKLASVCSNSMPVVAAECSPYAAQVEQINQAIDKRAMQSLHEHFEAHGGEKMTPWMQDFINRRPLR